MKSCHHVAYQEGSVSFYVPELFSSGEHYNVSVPMLTSDIYCCLEKSRQICHKFYSNRISCLFWKNHPIQRVCVYGLVINHQWKELLRTREEFMLITLDDCTSTQDMRPMYLVCKCSKEVLLGCGLQSNLSGNRIRVYGTMSFKYSELQAEYLEFGNDLTKEIRHWERAIKARHLLNIPWELDQKSLEMFYSQRDSSDEEQDFVKQLQFAAVKDELFISSQDEDRAQICHLQSSAIISSSTEQEAHMERNANVGASCILIDSSEAGDGAKDCTYAYPRDSISHITEVATYSNNRARSTFTTFLIACNKKEISMVELFQMRPINDFLRRVTEFRYNQQNVAMIRSMEELKSDIFTDLIDKMCSFGLLFLKNQNVISIEPLKRLHDYCTKRLLALVQLKCHSGTLDHEYIKAKLGSPNFSKRAIVDIFKLSLKAIAERHPRLLKSWWIDIHSEKSSTIHLKYQNN